MARSSALALLLLNVHSLAGMNTSALSALPLRFEANQGQSSAAVNFLARGASGTVLLRSRGAVVKARGADPVYLDLTGAIAPAAAEPLDPLSARSNYYLGRDPAQWHLDVPNFGRVRYRHVWSGIDLVYYGSSNRLEYDFVVAPGADPRAIGFAVRGASRVHIAANGDLILGDRVRQHKPLVYQETAAGRRFVAGSYALSRGNRVGFRIGAYDRALPLIIDPVISYSTMFGGSGNDSAAGIAADFAGNVYITGTTDSSDLPAGVAGSRFIGTPPDVFIAKIKPDGTGLVYCTYLGGESDDEARAIAIDPSGNAYITGVTFSTRFPATGGTVQSTYGLGKSDAFVAKIGPAGALVYATYLGGLGADEGRGIAADADGNAYVTGITSSGNFPVSVGAYQSKYKGGVHDGFVAKLGPSGTGLAYSTFLGSTGDDQPAAIAIDPAGNAYVTGSTDADDFPTTQAAYQTAASNPVSVAFVVKLNPAGTPAYSTYLGGEISDAAKGIAVDFAGNAYIAGVTSSPGFPSTDGALKPGLSGPSDAFVVKLNAAGNDLIYSTYLGGSDADGATGIAIDLVGNAYVTGTTRSPDFPANASLQGTRGGGVDGFVAKLDPKGAALVYSSYIGGVQDEQATAIAVDPLSNAYVTGTTSSPNFPTTPGAVRASLAALDSFVVKFHDVDLPLIASDSSSLSFVFDVLGTPPPVQVLHITSTSGPVAISAATDAAWLQVDPSGATPVALNVSVNTTRLALGSYKGNVVISAQGAANSPISIPVKFEFTRSGQPVPVPNNITPGTIAAGSGDTLITINGSNFVPGSTVQVNGVTVASTFFDSGTLTAVIPGSMLANPGALSVTVVNPGQTSPVLTVSVLVNAVVPVVSGNGVVNAASLLPGPVTAGEFILINGDNLGPKDTAQATAMAGLYPTTLGGTSVSFDGTAAALLSAGAKQIAAIVPFEVAGQHSTQFQVTFNGQKSNPAALAVAAAAPGVFTADASGTGQANAINEDGAANGKVDPAIAGTVVTFLATGGGQTNPAGVDGALVVDPIPQVVLPVAMQMGGEDCTDISAAPIPGMVSGLIQVSARVPTDLSGTVSAVIFVGGIPSQPGVTLEVQPADAMPASSRPHPLRRLGR